MELKPIAVRLVRNPVTKITQDLEALPEEAFTKDWGGCARTIADLIHEIILVNEHVRLTIAGEPLFDWVDEGWIKAPPEMNSKQSILEAFQSASAKVIATVEALDEADLEGKVTTEHGETTRFERCQFMMLHMMYHSGQFNFMQTLLGDNEWHWN